MVFEKVQKIIADQMRIKDLRLIKPESDIKSDVKADSLDIAEMLFELESQFDIEVPTDRALNMKKVGEVVALIEELIAAKK